MAISRRTTQTIPIFQRRRAKIFDTIAADHFQPLRIAPFQKSRFARVSFPYDFIHIWLLFSHPNLSADGASEQCRSNNQADDDHRDHRSLFKLGAGGKVQHQK